VGLNPESIRNGGPKAAEGGKEALLAQLLEHAEVQLCTMKERVAILLVETGLDRQADEAKEEEDEKSDHNPKPSPPAEIFEFRISNFDWRPVCRDVGWFIHGHY
jgi:hypothetical protein